MLDIEQILRDEAAALEEAVSERSVPSFRPPRVRRWPKVVVPLAAAAALVAVIAGAALTRSDDDRRVATIPTPPPPTSTGAPTTNVAPTTTLPPATPFPTGAPLESIAETGGPIALNPVPEGFLPAEADHRTVGTQPESWGATYLHYVGDTPSAGRFFEVSVESMSVDDDPYAMTGVDAEVVQFGTIMGKVRDPSTGIGAFVGELSPTSYLVVNGPHLSRAEIEIIVTGFQPDGLVLTSVPDGYRRIELNESSADESWYSTTYTSNGSTGEWIDVGLIVNPRKPLVANFIYQDARMVEFDGRRAVIGSSTLSFDLTPTIRVSVGFHRALRGPTPTTDELIVLARSIVALSDEEWAALRRYVQEHPPAPVITTCGPSDLEFSDITTNSPTFEPLGEFAVLGPGGTFTVTARAEPAVESLTVSARSPWDGTLIPLASAAVAGPTPFTVTWDGTINGEPAPPGYYTLQVIGTFTVDQFGNTCQPNDFEQGNLIKALYYIE